MNPPTKNRTEGRPISVKCSTKCVLSQHRFRAQAIVQNEERTSESALDTKFTVSRSYSRESVLGRREKLNASELGSLSDGRLIGETRVADGGDDDLDLVGAEDLSDRGRRLEVGGGGLRAFGGLAGGRRAWAGDEHDRDTLGNESLRQSESA